jgi:hypothetical protein
MSEPKKGNRIRIMGSAEVRREDNPSVLHALTANISYGGLGLSLRESIQGHVQINLFFGDRSGKDIGELVDGKVIWQKSMRGWCAAGIQFDFLNPMNHPITLKFLDQGDKKQFRNS